VSAEIEAGTARPCAVISHAASGGLARAQGVDVTTAVHAMARLCHRALRRLSTGAFLLDELQLRRDRHPPAHGLEGTLRPAGRPHRQGTDLQPKRCATRLHRPAVRRLPAAGPRIRPGRTSDPRSPPPNLSLNCTSKPRGYIWTSRRSWPRVWRTGGARPRVGRDSLSLSRGDQPREVVTPFVRQQQRLAAPRRQHRGCSCEGAAPCWYRGGLLPLLNRQGRATLPLGHWNPAVRDRSSRTAEGRRVGGPARAPLG
jgi:hypothetical protein